MRDQRRLSLTLIVGMIISCALALSVFFLFGIEERGPAVAKTAILSGSMYEERDAQTRILSITLPEEFDTAQSLLFKTTHTAIEVSVGRETVHVHGRENNPSFLKSPGALWHIVDLPEGSAGKTLSIYIHAVYENYYGNDPVIRYGSHDGCSMHLLTANLPIVLINVIILFVGIFCIFLHSFGWMRKSNQAKNSFLFVGLFALSIASWSLCQSGFLQFLLPSGSALYLIDFFSFYLFPACFNLFVASICKGKSETLFCTMSAAYLGESLLFTILQFTGVADMFETLRIGHLTMALNVFFVFYCLRKEITVEKNLMAKKFRMPLYVVMCFAAGELVTYYLRDFRETSYFIPLGTIVFIIMLACQLVTQYYHSLLEEEKMAYFEKLANTDMLTEVFNRNAYEDRLRSLEQQELELQSTCVVLFDINNMKDINDHYGHECGDQALKVCCRCILSAFGDEGNCYRIGGDEFVYLGRFHDSLAQKAARFSEIVRQEAKELSFPFRVAVGYACYSPETDHALRDVIRRSDEMMYRNKELQKHHEMPFGFSTEKAALVDK